MTKAWVASAGGAAARNVQLIAARSFGPSIDDASTTAISGPTTPVAAALAPMPAPYATRPGGPTMLRPGERPVRERGDRRGDDHRRHERLQLVTV
jgi:hypothetical protein